MKFVGSKCRQRRDASPAEALCSELGPQSPAEAAWQGPKATWAHARQVTARSMQGFALAQGSVFAPFLSDLHIRVTRGLLCPHQQHGPWVVLGPQRQLSAPGLQATAKKTDGEV